MNIKATLFGVALAQIPVGAIAQTYGKYETPAYTVEARLGDIEIRQYAPYIAAEVTVRGEERRALNRGFQVLAGYIFGGNSASSSIEMTAPVGQSQQIDMTSPVGQSGENGTWTVTFSMPREWTMETLPKPNNEAVQFREVPAQRQVVYMFSGRATPSALETAEAVLREQAEANGLQTTGQLFTYYYDDPMTLPWKRRNEVALALDAQS